MHLVDWNIQREPHILLNQAIGLGQEFHVVIRNAKDIVLTHYRI
jgi:hypothetical protein